MRPLFDLKVVLELITVSAVSGLSAFLMVPLLVSRIMTPLTVSFVATLISVPLIWYFVEVPHGKIDFREYYSARGLLGITVDALLVFLVAIGPAAIFMYFLLALEIMSIVAVPSAAAIGLFTGLSAFLFRNRSFYEDNSLDVNF